MSGFVDIRELRVKPIVPHYDGPYPGPVGRRPDWLKAPAAVGQNYKELKKLVSDLKLHTVCESAACPNLGECWNRRTATFMILGNVCTRRCGFCAVQKGAPEEVDWDEPRRVAEAVEAMGLRYAVITSVNRDDRKDGGATLFAHTIEAIRERLPECHIEVLVPDFQGSHDAMDIVLAARPNVLNHNTETVPRLYRTARIGSRYERTLDMLRYAGEAAPTIPTKSGIMLGLGETEDEIIEVMHDFKKNNVDIMTMGRWSSDCYRLYVRACFGHAVEWSRKAGSTSVDDVAEEYKEVDCY